MNPASERASDWTAPRDWLTACWQRVKACYRDISLTWRIVLWSLVFLAAVTVLYFVLRLTSDRAVTYDSPEEHFKYGSTGGERLSGIPYSIWKVLPRLFADSLPGGHYDPTKPYAAFGFIYEDGKDLPIGVSKRKVQGIDRVFLNCAICHAGTYRESPDATRKVVLGMPANSVDLQAFQNFLFEAAVDERFNPNRLLAEIDNLGSEDAINRKLLKLVGVSLMQQRLILLRDRFAFTHREPDFGPGRVDTFNPPKVLLNFPMDKVPEEEWVGITDFPSIWQQGKKQGLQLHWDGNNTRVEERNRSAAFGTGAYPPTLERNSLERIEEWIAKAEPPPFPFPIDESLAAQGRIHYERYCMDCHGKNGRDFSGSRVGKVTPIEQIGTDRWRLDSYSRMLAVAQNQLYAEHGDERFSHFRKTFGYANLPLDGLWLRAPYLHNGTVPTLYDLLEPSEDRPEVIFRGYDVYDQRKVGFVSDVPEENGRRFFRIETRTRPGDTPRERNEGNGNWGHEGRVTRIVDGVAEVDVYGTDLPREEKDAIIEYLKTF